MAYATVKISSREASETPNRVFYDSETVQAYESLIAYDYDTARRVFFVTGKDGEEFGQFETEEIATKIAISATQYNELKANLD